MLPLNLLRVFHQVAVHQNVVKASESLFISQPAVSHALKKLQEELQISLLYKSGRNLHLTEEGRELHAMTTRLFGVEEEIEAYLTQQRTTTEQNIHIGLVTIYERFGVEEILQRFAAIDESILVSIHSGNSRSILEMLRANSIHMGISGDVLVDPNFHYKLYKRHEVFLVAPEGHRLYGQETFTAADLRHERMVLKESGSSVRQTMDIFFDTIALAPHVVTELANLDSILNIVRREQCLTFLPDRSVAEVTEGGTSYSMARYADGPLTFNTYLVYPKESINSGSIRHIITQFCAMVSEKDD